jgi:hypothetical protein
MLPVEVLDMVLSFLSPRDLCRMCLVSRLFYRVATNPRYWTRVKLRLSVKISSNETLTFDQLLKNISYEAFIIFLIKINNILNMNLYISHSTTYISPLSYIELHPNLFRPIQTYPNLLKPIKTYQNLSKPIKTYQNLSKPFKTYQNLSKPIKTYQNLSKPILPNQNLSKPILIYANLFLQTSEEEEIWPFKALAFPNGNRRGKKKKI